MFRIRPVIIHIMDDIHTYRKLFLAALLAQRNDINDGTRNAVIAAYAKSSENQDILDRDVLREFLNDLNIGLSVPMGMRSWPKSDQIERAEGAARLWLERRVFTIASAQIGSDNTKKSGLPGIFFAWGGMTDFKLPRVSILNSRKPLHVRPDDRWVRLSRYVFDRVCRNDTVLVSGLGNHPYDYISYLGRSNERPMVIVCRDVLPFMADDASLKLFLDAYGEFLSRENTLLISPFTPGNQRPIQERLAERDRCVAGLSGLICAVEVRSGGNMEKITVDALKKGKNVWVFQPKRFDDPTGGNKKLIETGAEALKIDTEPERKRSVEETEDSAVSLSYELDGGPYLIHFTRSCPGPWPGQSIYAYYRSVDENHDGAGHSGFDTLKLILQESRIRGSNRLIRGEQSVVSFTACSIDDLKNLIAWRPGLIRWTMEPYGIAFERNVLKKIGAEPVIYGNENDWLDLSKENRYRFQLHVPSDTDWSYEKEWRLAGDFYFADIPAEFVRIIVSSEKEALEIYNDFGMKPVVANRSEP